MKELEDFTPRVRIAYFSMEIALHSQIHTYAGGLGVLAGDTLRSCADFDMPVVFVTLISRIGYFRQELDHQGNQLEHPDPWDPERWAKPLTAMIGVEIEGRDVWVRPWLYVHTASGGNSVPVLLLDTDVYQNDERDRNITHALYGGDEGYRLKQEVVLGVAGCRLLQALGFRIATYHLNEGHAALLAVELLRRFRRPASRARSGRPSYDADRVRDLCVFTTHTPVEAGHDKFSYELVARTTNDLVAIETLKSLAGDDRLNMTRLALNLSAYVNGVALEHGATARAMFPGYDVRAITNGVHPGTWTHPAFASLYDAYLPQWRHDPEVLVRADRLADEAVWAAHREVKGQLCRLIRDATGVVCQEDVPIIGFARRMTGYKRPDLLFHDLDRLAEIAREHPFQAVFAGKAHPRDTQGKALIKTIHESMRRLEGKIAIAFLPDYDLEMAKTLVTGVDIWLNTPAPPQEASGTSGMKAAFNGVVNLSTLDGWWIEGRIEGVTGWTIEGTESGVSEVDSLYSKLADEVLPMYYTDRSRWIWMMKQSISKIASYFNSHRMVRRYAADAYIR